MPELFLYFLHSELLVVLSTIYIVYIKYCANLGYFVLQTLQSCSRYWVRTKTLGVNIGGLAAGVYVLLRTAYQSSDNAETVGQRTNDENVQVTDT